MQHLVSAKTLFLICGLYAGCLALPSGTGYAFSGTDNPPGLRLVGRTVDGAIVIDGSDSQLTDLETIAVITRRNIPNTLAPELISIGTIESFDQANNLLVVAGQNTFIPRNTQLIDASSGKSSSLGFNGKDIHDLHIGRHVAVAGDIIGLGQSIATFVVLIPTPAARGTSLVYVRGILQESNPNSRELVIGNTKLDLGIVRSSDYDNLSPGDLLEVVGYDAGPGQLTVTGLSKLAPQDPLTTGNPAPQDTALSSGLNGIHGSGLKGIHGSGLKGIHGSGLKGIHGSGLKGIHGSGLKGIHGSGLKAAPLEPSADNR